MRLWRKAPGPRATPGEAADRVRAKYASFRELLGLNNEALELLAALQEDLRYAPPRRDVLGGRIAAIFERIRGAVGALEGLTGLPAPTLASHLQAQQQEIERYAATMEEVNRPRLSAWLSELDAGSLNDAGSKAAVLGEVRNKLGLPTPDGFVLTTEAYRQYCGIPLWMEIRDAARGLDLNDLDAIRRVSESLTRRVLETPLPRSIEVAIAGRAETLLKHGGALAVRSSARGEGGEKSFAGQFLSELNVPADGAVDAYKRVIAGRFSERALFYRLSNGLLEVETPMAALFLLMVPARAAGIMYTRDPADPRSNMVWITATRGLGSEIASGRAPADLFLVSRSRPHKVVERNVVRKEHQVAPRAGGGLDRISLPEGARDDASLQEGALHTLAEWGVRIEQHFGSPQDVEWVLDASGELWIVQARPLAGIETPAARSHSRPKCEPRVQGGRTIYPGRTSGDAFLIDDAGAISKTPEGSVVFIRKPSPEIVEIFPRIAGLVAEWGNVAGHAAALLREFRIPSVFQMQDAFARVAPGEPVSLDAVQARVYPGVLWPAVRRDRSEAERRPERNGDPIASRLLTLNLLDPSAHNFRPAGCRSAHDVLRYCHETAIEAMFEVNDRELEAGAPSTRQLRTSLPLHISVLDLGGGVTPGAAESRQITPDEIVSRPFRALWEGVNHPAVTWTREMPASFGDLASVLMTAFTPQGGGMRALGERSYLLVAGEYMNLNSRLAYHYSLVDACLCDTPACNYISFRFEGGGAPRPRRSLRACFLERCLLHYGFGVDRRTDLVNAWHRKAPAGETAARLDILGRLLACSSQLDMYMESREVMNWFAEQFIAGNYAFRPPAPAV